MATYFELFGDAPRMTRHAIERMNEAGISREQLFAALGTAARQGTSPGTIMFVDWTLTVIVDHVDGRVITVWFS